jgi:hypothetical protein
MSSLSGPEARRPGRGAGIQRLRAAVPCGGWWCSRHARSGGRDLICFPKREDVKRRDRRIFLVGQFGGRKNGGRHRLERGGEVRGRRPPQAIGSGDGLYGPTRPTSRPRSAWSASAMRLPLHQSWNGESPRYAAPVPKWNSISTAGSGMVSVPVPVRVRTDGSTAPSDSGRGPSSPVFGASRGCGCRTQNQTIGQSRNRDAGQPCQYRNEEAAVHRQFSPVVTEATLTDIRAELQVITHPASAI